MKKLKGIKIVTSLLNTIIIKKINEELCDKENPPKKNFKAAWQDLNITIITL